MGKQSHTRKTHGLDHKRYCSVAAHCDIVYVYAPSLCDTIDLCCTLRSWLKTNTAHRPHWAKLSSQHSFITRPAQNTPHWESWKVSAKSRRGSAFKKRTFRTSIKINLEKQKSKAGPGVQAITVEEKPNGKAPETALRVFAYAFAHHNTSTRTATLRHHSHADRPVAIAQKLSFYWSILIVVLFYRSPVCSSRKQTRLSRLSLSWRLAVEETLLSIRLLCLFC